ncbi:hypothetical protein EJ994_08870 [Maribacter sp. MJ134]|uniref:hypothetical protein n=1 Tax=Maribacter sp. MJ134 TaxID=2496865 RepID=UPI000F81D190|nr:hypothetical protein [Maribacter sp. MJ134]AZQ58913.1 hypothetical protein EJ994_08870 [Maribacter sp. MJ134]
MILAQRVTQKEHQTELDFLRDLGEKKVKSLKIAYELTERELALILKLHRRSKILDKDWINKFIADN